MSDNINLDIQQTTTTSVPPLGKELVVKPAPAIRRVEHGYRQGRFFLGPMPEGIAAVPNPEGDSVHTSGLGKRLGLGLRRRIPSTPLRRSISSHDSISRERAFTFFISKGGRPEQFEENSVKAEMLRRLRASRWFPEEQGSSGAVPTSSNWVGETFEIGKDVLGLPTLAEPKEDPQRCKSPDLHAESVGSLKGKSNTSSKAVNDQVTTSGAKKSPVESMHDSIRHLQDGNGNSPPSVASFPVDPGSSQVRLLASSKDVQINKTDSSGRLLTPRATEIPTSADMNMAEQASLILPPTIRSKGKARVTFLDGIGDKRTTDQEPDMASPHEVLTREPTPTTSAGAAARVQDELEPIKDSDILIRDRMIVRVLSTNSGVGKYLDEKQLLEMPEARKERATMWREYLVVWKSSYVELYEPHAVLTREWMTNQMHLAFQIPLLPSKTTVSIFSNVDMSFCITTPKLSAHLHLPTHLFNQDKQITFIFIMKPKTRSRAVDWTWRLWRKLGGEIPDAVEIRCPILNVRVTFPIPSMDMVTGVEGYKTFTRDKVIEDCREQMGGVPEWDLIIESALQTGVEQNCARLELCWRTESKLDWVWLEDDVDGMNRPWAVLFGIASKNPRFTSDLELRVAEHFPTKLALGNGIVLEEPPAVEGYLYRYKTESHVRDPVYLSSHNGNIFFLSTDSAHPPQPPTVSFHPEAVPNQEGGPSSGDGGSSMISWESEVRRGAAQMLNAKTFLDMRNVVAIRRAVEPWVAVNEAGFLGSGFKRTGKASTPSTEPGHLTTTNATSSEGYQHGYNQEEPDIRIPGAENDDGESGELPLSEEDAADEGGDEVLDKLSGDERSVLKTKRSFEIAMKNKEVIRFEAYSCKVNLEWISKLRALVLYWTHKQRLEARLEMDIVHAISGRTRFLVSGTSENATPALPPNPREASDLLGKWWHWCVLDGCRSIVRAGRLYMRTTARGVMRHYYFVLVHGHLMRFKLSSRSTSILHSHAKTINLLDAYVTSGYFAALELDEGRKAFEPMARRFQDGLETDDTDMDTLIIIRYRNLPVDHQLQKHARMSSEGTAVSSHGVLTPTGKTTRTSLSDAITSKNSIPALNGRHSLLVLRARSKLERDSWCWALNVEVERLVREHSVREQGIREDGRIRR